MPESSLLSNSSILGAVLETLVPAEDGFPAADEPQIQVAFKKDIAADGNENLLDRLLKALPEDFATRSGLERENALKVIEANDQATFGAVLRHVYNAYWSNQTVREVLERVDGYPARPPHYAGYEMKPFDQDSLAVQRKRMPFWREAD